MINKNSWRLFDKMQSMQKKEGSSPKKRTSFRYLPVTKTKNEDQENFNQNPSNSFSKSFSSLASPSSKKEKLKSKDPQTIDNKNNVEKNSKLSPKTPLIKIQKKAQSINLQKNNYTVKANDPMAILEKLKRDFVIFKKFVLGELEKQEKLMKKIIEESIEQYFAKQAPQSYKKLKTFEGEIQRQLPYYRQSSPSFSTKSKNSILCSLKLIPFLEEEKQSLKKKKNEEKQDKNFSRFFNAMNKLRNGLQDMESLSSMGSFMNVKKHEIKRISSQKNEKKKLSS